ncbi:PH and SEC7 domain-containing protein 1-like [Haliotis asinina]|uniref:PH and SEC7 domain-containing protein 1-like n=1 Tax=Haliotis asinina TaxID=109174 RepID=UPI003531B814
MASRTTQSPSRIPIPVRSPPPPMNGRLAAREQREANKLKEKDSLTLTVHENGIVEEVSPPSVSPQNRKGKGFETFLMTGDMIIKTTPPHQPKSRQDGSKSGTPKSGGEDMSYSDVDGSIRSDQSSLGYSPHLNLSGVSQTVKNIPSPAFPLELPRAPVATVEDLSDMSQSSGSESLIASLNEKMQLSQGEKVSPVTEDSSQEAVRSPVEVIIVNGDRGSDKSLQDVPSSGDSGVHPDIHSSDSDVGEKSSSLPEVPNSEDAINRVMVTSQSAEKITSQQKQAQPQQLVRTSKSHENYLESGNAMQLVSIDIDDNMAYSLDQLAYCNDSSTASLDNVSEPASRSLHNSPERKPTEKTSERVFMPAFISLDDPKPLKAKVKDKPKDDDSPNDCGEKLSVNNSALETSSSGSTHSSQLNSSDEFEEVQDINHIDLDLEFSDAESLYHQPMKGVDRPSASRLAKRLFMLDGFRKSDVSRHLSKKNEFSTLVAEEYLKFFDFKGLSLDGALRKFLLQFSLSGETQERERVLAHFSHHYMICNPGSFNSDDACHTLTCAIMLLNTDLHGQFVGRKMTCSEFIDNLSELNDGENFPREVLKSIYQSIKLEQLDWAVDDDMPEADASQEAGPQSSSGPIIGQNPFLDTPDPNKTVEYKKGYVMRKCCKDMDGRRTPMGKRGWKMFCAVLRDMILYLYKDEHQLKKGGFVENANNSIRIHHSLATKATDYTKKQHVFRLQTADWCEYLFQTSDSKELQEWIDTINMVAATFSAPPLPGGCGSKTRFQRPLLSSCYTRHNMKDQLMTHEDHVSNLEQDLHQHRAVAPEKGAKARVIQDYLDKENYLEFELKRYKTYVYLLQAKMTSFPELEPSLVETAIGEDEEVGMASDVSRAPAVPPFSTPAKPVQRSLSDRLEDKADHDMTTVPGSEFLYINVDSFDTYL